MMMPVQDTLFMPEYTYNHLPINWAKSVDRLVERCYKIIQKEYPVSNFTRAEDVNTSAVIRATLIYTAEHVKHLTPGLLNDFLSDFRATQWNQRTTVYLSDEMRDKVEIIGSAIADRAEWKGLRFIRRMPNKMVYNYLLIFYISLKFFISQHS